MGHSPALYQNGEVNYEGSWIFLLVRKLSVENIKLEFQFIHKYALPLNVVVQEVSIHHCLSQTSKH